MIFLLDSDEFLCVPHRLLELCLGCLWALNTHPPAISANGSASNGAPEVSPPWDAGTGGRSLMLVALGPLVPTDLKQQEGRQEKRKDTRWQMVCLCGDGFEFQREIGGGPPSF